MKPANSPQRKNRRRRRALARMAPPQDNSWDNDNSSDAYIRTYRAIHNDGERHGPSLLAAGLGVTGKTSRQVLVLGVPKVARASRRQLL